MGKTTFLSARWEYLAMFNYETDPGLLQQYIPSGTEIDFYDGRAFISVVGFLFNDTRVMGIRWPGHTKFEEVNLRYYIKRFDGKDWKRGVGFVSEIVPRRIISFMANRLYNEQYSTARMKHMLRIDDKQIQVDYAWQKKNMYNNLLQVTAENRPSVIQSGSAEEFIFEHYYGYNQLAENKIIEYAVHHPRWQTYPVTGYNIDCDVELLYGKDFVPFLKDQVPHSVFLAKGSEVTVDRPVTINTFVKG